MLDQFLDQVSHWDWWILGLVLITLEALAPAAVFLWLGVAAGIIGGAVFFFPDMSWENQVMAFSLLSVASVIVGRRYLRWRPLATDHPLLNRRGQQYVGRTATVAQPIINGKGSIHLDDTTWTVSGKDLPAGKVVKIVGVDGTVLQVEEKS